MDVAVAAAATAAVAMAAVVAAEQKGYLQQHLLLPKMIDGGLRTEAKESVLVRRAVLEVASAEEESTTRLKLPNLSLPPSTREFVTLS